MIKDYNDTLENNLVEHKQHKDEAEGRRVQQKVTLKLVGAEISLVQIEL